MRASSLAFLVALALSGCDAATAPGTGLHTQLTVPLLVSDGQPRPWPSVPVVTGGSLVKVRGTVEVGCGEPEAFARRGGDAVDVVVRVRPRSDEGPCRAIVASWRPFEVDVFGLPSGTWRVRARVDGHDHAVDTAVPVTLSGT